jgi:hypothetical protein
MTTRRRGRGRVRRGDAREDSDESKRRYSDQDEAAGAQESPLRGQPKQLSQPNELSQGRGGAERGWGSRSEGGAREREKKGGGGSEGCER